MAQPLSRRTDRWLSCLVVFLVMMIVAMVMRMVIIIMTMRSDVNGVSSDDGSV